MKHQGWDLQLIASAARDWRANVLAVGIAHSIVGGSVWEPTPWWAVQRAAWEAPDNAYAIRASSRKKNTRRSVARS
jgi:hypothetical protein